MKKISNNLIIMWVVLSLWGILNIFSATYAKAIKQGVNPFRSIIVTSIVFLIFFFISFIIKRKSVQLYKILLKSINFLFLISLFSLILVAIIGSERGGAKSVIDLIIVDFQPLEMVKITGVLFLAFSFDNRKVDLGVFRIGNLQKPLNLIKLAILMLVPIALIITQPDLGGGLIILSSTYVMFCINGEYSITILKYGLGLVVLGIILVFVIVKIPALQNYQMERIITWFDPFADIKDTGWGTINSLVGISNGNIFGTGLFQSVQKTFIGTGASTDYIYVIICEEWGIFGSLFTIGMIGGLSYNCILIGNYARTRFGMLYCYGYAFLLIIQLTVNIAGVTNVIPMTGVTLPFISSGINSYGFLTIGLFICIIIERYTTAYNKKRELEEW